MDPLGRCICSPEYVDLKTRSPSPPILNLPIPSGTQLKMTSQAQSAAFGVEDFGYADDLNGLECTGHLAINNALEGMAGRLPVTKAAGSLSGIKEKGCIT